MTSSSARRRRRNRTCRRRRKTPTFSRPSSSPRRGWHARIAEQATIKRRTAPYAPINQSRWRDRQASAIATFCRLFNYTSGGCRFGANCIYRHAYAKCGKDIARPTASRPERKSQPCRGSRHRRPQPQL